MGRLVILFIPLIALAFFGGLYVGRAGRRKAVATATQNVRPVVVAARNLATLNWLSDPEQATLARQETLIAIDQYDQDQRTALHG